MVTKSSVFFLFYRFNTQAKNFTHISPHTTHIPQAQRKIDQSETMDFDFSKISVYGLYEFILV